MEVQARLSNSIKPPSRFGYGTSGRRANVDLDDDLRQRRLRSHLSADSAAW
ncbi:hypothetical protein KURONO_1616 [Mycobacterium tuberculosis str. Kurono]|nr:hypothetical protein KURONO_1616 [Mycobacterium tuberculosis str. Kurono]BAW12386.1 hypothetical protein NCGM946K2_1601 [Mycobacterium tuberculosis]